MMLVLESPTRYAACVRSGETPSCIVSDENAMSLQMQKLLRQAGQDVPDSKPDLEINAAHPLLEAMAAEADDARFASLAQLLVDQAMLAEGADLADPAAYVRRVNELLVSALGGGSLSANAPDESASSG